MTSPICLRTTVLKDQGFFGARRDDIWTRRSSWGRSWLDLTENPRTQLGYVLSIKKEAEPLSIPCFIFYFTVNGTIIYIMWFTVSEPNHKANHVVLVPCLNRLQHIICYLKDYRKRKASVTSVFSLGSQLPNPACCSTQTHYLFQVQRKRQ